MASSGAAIITDNISLVKSCCNLLFETMNSNPRLVTPGRTITSQIFRISRRGPTIAAAQLYLSLMLYQRLFPIDNAFYRAYTRARHAFILLTARPNLCPRKRFIWQFAPRHHINRAHAYDTRARARVLIASLIKLIILTILRPLPLYQTSQPPIFIGILRLGYYRWPQRCVAIFALGAARVRIRRIKEKAD